MQITLTLVIGLVVGLLVGRELGWTLSKALLYVAPTGVAAVLCIVRALFVAYITRRFIEWQHAGVLWKVILYGAGAYIAIPNYGLFREDTIPLELQPKHQIISTFPWLTFIVASVGFAFLVKV